MKSITKEYKINASVEKVWETLTDVKRIEKWSGSRCKMSDVEGSAFELWDGDIWGKNIEVIKQKKLIQEWNAGKWKAPSIVCFELMQDGNNSVLRLTHTKVPDEETESIDTGWDDYYLEPLRVVAENS